jgi:Protein-disulfide isomerase
MTMFSVRRVFALLVLLLLFPATVAHGAQKGLSQAEFADLLRRALKENPEIVLDVLRDNSIAVLEIAQKGSQERQFNIMRAQWRKDVTMSRKVAYDRPMLGNPKAPVTIVAYSDYTCPFCADTAETVLEVLRDRKNTVRFIFKNFPRKDQPLARMASEYVTAAFLLDEGKAWAYHDIVFGDQIRLLKEGEGMLRAEALALGFNLQKLAAEAKGRRVKAIIDEDIAEATANGVPGTPFHLVNNLSVRGGMPLPAFLEAVDTASSLLKGGSLK